MKKRQLLLTLQIRYASSILYAVCSLIYGCLVIIYYQNENVHWDQALGVILSYLLGMICILVKCETISKVCDPLNQYNRKCYVAMLLLEFGETMVAYYFSTNSDRRIWSVYIYMALVVFLSFIIVYMHKKIIDTYKQLHEEDKISLLICDYERQNCVVEVSDGDVGDYFKSFLFFAGYVVVLNGFYRLIERTWIGVVLFALINIIVLYRLFWKGIRVLQRNSRMYFGMVAVISTLGLFFVTGLSRGAIVIGFMGHREVQEYYMLFVLFYLPLCVYGLKAANQFMLKNYRWCP